MSLYRNIATLLFAGHLSLCIALPAEAAEEGGKTFFSINPAGSNIQLLEDRDRAEWQQLAKVIELLSIKPGETIADIGSGTGYFTEPLARKTGKDGIVYAVDIDKGMADYLEKRAVREGLNNIRSILAEPDDPLLPTATVDMIFICNTYMFIGKRDQYLARLKDAMKTGGLLVIISYNMIEAPGAPPLHKRVSREKTIKEVQKAGFKLQAEHSFLSYQHFLIFEKP